MNVLVTGSSGAIGQAVCRELIGRGHTVRGFDLARPREPMVGLDMQVGDVADAEAVDSAMAGVDAVAHLAAFPDDADFKSVLLPSNVVGVYHVLESARRLHVQRVVLTSSCTTVQGHDWRHRTIRVDDSYAPNSHYAVTKIMAEGWARYYAQQLGMSVIVVRPGAFPRDENQWANYRADKDAQRMYLSPRDAGCFYAQCVETPDISFAVLFATSRPNGPVAFDLEPARKLIGYEPQDTWVPSESSG